MRALALLAALAAASALAASALTLPELLARAPLPTRPPPATEAAPVTGLAASRRHRDKEGCPVAGLAAACPPFKTVKRKQTFVEREYAPGVWASADVADAARLETAAARGAVLLNAYWRGANEGGRTLDPTAPLFVGFDVDKQKDSDEAAASNWVASMWVGEKGRADAPDATNDAVRVGPFGRQTFYVANFTSGPATQGSVLARVEALVQAVKDAGGRVDARARAWLMSYSPAAQLTGRYYEVAVAAKGKKEEGEEEEDAWADYGLFGF